MNRQAKVLIPTMKADGNDENENELAFRECQADIILVSDIKTTYGEKTIIALHNEELDDFQVFVNNKSMANLTELLGEEDKNWIGKIINLTLEKDENFNKNMIVLNPVA